MNYGNYGNYNEGGYSGYGEGSNYGRRGNYREGSYGRRGVDSRYRGNYGHYPMMDRMDAMREMYMNYNEGREQYGRGNYGGGEDEMIQATEGIMKNITEIVEELADSQNPQVMQIIQKHTKKMMEM